VHNRPNFFLGAVAAALLLTVARVHAADTHIAWEGFLTFTGNRPAACDTTGGVANYDTHVSIYRPKLGSGDTSPTFLSILFTRAVLDLQNTSESTAHQMNGTGNYSGFAVNSKAKAFQYTGGTFNLTVTPNPVTADTNTVSITGTIANMFNTAGCNRTFKAIYVKKID
jgi:hypothetical protein